MEIASLIEYVPDLVPVADREEFLFDLRHPAVATYYEEHYPLLLPRLYRSRLESTESRSARLPLNLPPLPEAELNSLQGLFQAFLALENRARADDDIGMFLWFLDGGRARADTKSQGGKRDAETYGIEDAISCLRKRDLFVERLLRPLKEQDALDCALRGFGKSLAFCVDFELLLRRCGSWPLCQSALWHYYAYWFELIRDRVGDTLYQAIDTVAAWQWEQTSVENQAMNEYIERIRPCIDRPFPSGMRERSAPLNAR